MERGMEVVVVVVMEVAVVVVLTLVMVTLLEVVMVICSGSRNGGSGSSCGEGKVGQSTPVFIKEVKGKIPDKKHCWHLTPSSIPSLPLHSLSSLTILSLPLSFLYYLTSPFPFSPSSPTTLSLLLLLLSLPCPFSFQYTFHFYKPAFPHSFIFPFHNFTHKILPP